MGLLLNWLLELILKVKTKQLIVLKKFTLESKSKKILKGLLKFCISGLALSFVLYNVDLNLVGGLLMQANWMYLVLASVFFSLSKIFSAFRLNIFFNSIDLNISTKYNLKLYWIGMFYNLFLPGGIGGDAYKVYLLNKEFGTKIKSLLKASLIDRVSGLISLLFLVCCGFLWLEVSFLQGWMKTLNIICIVLIFPVAYIVTNFFFKIICFRDN